MLQYNSSVSGSLSVTGSLIVTNDISGTINGINIQSFSSSVSEKISDIQTTTGPQTAKLTSIEAFTSSTSARLNSIETISASNIARINSLETTSASVDVLNTNQNARLSALEVTSASVDTLNTNQNARLSALETTSASVDSLNTTQNNRLTDLEIKTGSLATTGSNTFIGTQTITGSLFVSANLVVQGTSSLQNITASAVSIGTNIVNLNTANPAIRYAGLSIGDSGSIGGSGSFLYDSVQDEMIFVHRGANTTVTSSVVLMGPQTYDNIGTETYPTANRIQKGTGNEHLVDSCIFDDGTNVCINANLRGSGNACFTSICSSNVIGSTAIFGSTSGTCINITTNGNNGTSASPLQTSLNFRGLNDNLNGQIRVDDISGTAQIGSMQFYTWNGGQVSALTLCHNQSANFYGQVSASTFLASGCVGVGTSTISSTYGRLTVAGTGITIADDGNAKLQIGRFSSTACNAYIKMGNNACSLRFTNNTDLADLVVIEKGGNVGINTSSPLTTLTVKSTNDNGYALTRPSDASVYHLRISTTETGGDAYTVRYNTFNNDMLFTSYQSGGTGGNVVFRTTMAGGSGGETERFRITCHGIGVFSCQLCALQFRGFNYGVAPQGVFRGGLYVCNAVSGTGTDCSLTLFSEGGAGGGNFYIATGGAADVKFAMDANGVSCFRCRVCATGITTNGNLQWSTGDGTDWYIRGQANGPAIRMKYHGGSTNRSAGLGWVDNNSNYYETLCWQDTSMFAFGILCSNNTICAANFSSPGFLRVHNTMKTFAISKNIGERLSNSDYFRISSTSQGFQVMVYSIAQNVGVGWTQSQLFQASSAPYWGGWIGSSQAISTTGSGAGFISSAVNGNDGTITFRVSTGDNGTNTTGTILSYIQVTAFSIDSITLTAL